MGKIHFCSQTRNAIYLFILVAAGTCSIMFSLCEANFAWQVYSQQLAQACSDVLQGMPYIQLQDGSVSKFHITSK